MEFAAFLAVIGVVAAFLSSALKDILLTFLRNKHLKTTKKQQEIEKEIAVADSEIDKTQEDLDEGIKRMRAKLDAARKRLAEASKRDK